MGHRTPERSGTLKNGLKKGEEERRLVELINKTYRGESIIAFSFEVKCPMLFLEDVPFLVGCV